MADGPSPQGHPQQAEGEVGVTLSREAFAEQFAQVSNRLWCVAVAMVGDAQQAEDIVQEAAIVALDKLDQYRAGTSFAAWMGQIVRYTALNEHRRRERRRTAPTDPVNLESSRPADSPRTEAMPVSRHGNLHESQEAFDDRVVAGLEKLEATARGCLLLRTLLDLPYKQIAELMEVPEGTAMSHVHRARRALRRELHEAEPPEPPEQTGDGDGSETTP